MFEIGTPLVWVWVVVAVIVTTCIIFIYRREVVKYGEKVNGLLLFLVILLGLMVSSMIYALTALFHTYESDSYADVVQAREQSFLANLRVSEDAVTDRILETVDGDAVRYENAVRDILQEQHVSITVIDGDDEIPGIIAIHDQEISVTLYEDTEATAFSIE